MPGLVYQNPATGGIVWCSPSAAPPAGFTVLLSGSDGSRNRDVKQYQAGVNSGGPPRIAGDQSGGYTGDPTQPPPFVNGRLS